MSLLWVFALVVCQRLVEAAISRRNLRVMEGKGGKEFHSETFLPLVMLHVLFIVSLFIESVPWRVPLNPLTWTCLGLYLLFQILRYWCVISLGEWWNTRIVVLPGGSVIRDGPYRFLRHPLYLVVLLEFALLPLLLRAPMSFAAFFPVNILIMRHRISLEEKVLREWTDYGEKFRSLHEPA